MARILMVLRPPEGGATNHVASLTRELAARGHEVAVCGPHAPNAERFSGRVIHVEMGRDPSPRADLRATREVARAMRDFRPDLIHAHGSKGSTFARLARPAWPRAPLVWTPHNFAFTNYVASGSQRAVYRVLETALAPLATRIICVCEAEMRSAAKVFARRRARLVYNGVRPFEPSEPNPLAAELAERGPLIATVTLLQPPKGVTTLLSAMPEVLERVPDASLIVVGGGFLEADLQRQAHDLGVGDRVHMVGQVSQQAVGGVLELADLFVLPSWAEAFPYAVLEAMSAGLPCVATNVGGVPEAIEDGVSGRLVAPRDPHALGTALADLLEDREAAAALGRNARTRVEEKFTFDQTVDGVLSVYEEVGIR